MGEKEDWWIVWCFTQLSAIFQLYHSISWVIYQYYWSIYPDTRHSDVITTNFEVFGMNKEKKLLKKSNKLLFSNVLNLVLQKI